jgi:hypothetical protein
MHHKCTYISPGDIPFYTNLYRFCPLAPASTLHMRGRRTVERVAKSGYGGVSYLNQNFGTAFKTAGFSHLAHFLYQNNAFCGVPQTEDIG